MAAVASIIAIVLFLAFATAGAQKVLFNPMMSQAADHLGFTKKAYQRVGVLEIAGAIGVLVGLAAKGSSPWAIINEAAALGLAVTMALAVFYHIKQRDAAKLFTPALVLGILSLIELGLRLAQ